MATTTMQREAIRLLTALRQQTATGPDLERFRQDPARLMADAGMMPDPWQASLLRFPSPRTLLLCSRQSGKSTTAAALALRTALLESRRLVLLLSPSLRQSSELFRKVADLYRDLGRPVASISPRDSALHLDLANGSRIVSLPGSEGSIRGFSSVSLLLVDEAARVDDALYRSVRPMLAVSQGQLVCLSTPFGKRGWFHEEWAGRNPWQRVKITADQCQRIPAEFLEEERMALGERWYRQEYSCSFEETVDSVFAHADVMATLRDDLQPLFVG